MTYLELILTAIAVIVGIDYTVYIFNQLNAKLSKGRFSLFVTTNISLLMITAVVLTAFTLNLLGNLQITAFVFITRLLLSRLFLALLIMAFVPTIFVVIYCFFVLYHDLEKYSAKYQFKRYNLKNNNDFKTHPAFDLVHTKIYTQIALVFMAEYDNPYVLRTLNYSFTKLIILHVMSQLLLTRTMDELADEPHENWDLSKVRTILYDPQFRLINRYLGLHVHLAFCMLSLLIMRNQMIYPQISHGSTHQRRQTKG